jgi:hypothetical protein
MPSTFRDVDPCTLRVPWSRPTGAEAFAMNDPTRHEILAGLEGISKLAPDMRFGQLVANLAFMAAGPWDQTLWDLEDERLLGAIRQLESALSQRTPDPDGQPLHPATSADLNPAS